MQRPGYPPWPMKAWDGGPQGPCPQAKPRGASQRGHVQLWSPWASISPPLEIDLQVQDLCRCTLVSIVFHPPCATSQAMYHFIHMIDLWTPAMRSQAQKRGTRLDSSELETPQISFSSTKASRKGHQFCGQTIVNSFSHPPRCTSHNFFLGRGGVVRATPITLYRVYRLYVRSFMLEYLTIYT